jgi:uncharacterized protein (TIGR03083 family)
VSSVDHQTYLAHVTEQADALRAAAEQAGPDAPVPTCPKWTVRDLVTHIATVHNWVCTVVHLPPESERPAFPQAPENWTDLLDWWDNGRATMIAELAAADPAKPVWTFFPGLGSIGWWARRQAHETSIHRLDAEHAAHEKVPTLLFDSALAADGIDEVLGTMSVHRARAKRPEVTVEGTLLVHAADAGRAWLLRAQGGVVEVGPADAATHADMNLVGTADAVYRAVWKRPSTAITTGREDMLQAINGG